MTKYTRNWMHSSDARRDKILSLLIFGSTGLAILGYLVLALFVVHGVNSSSTKSITQPPLDSKGWHTDENIYPSTRSNTHTN